MATRIKQLSGMATLILVFLINVNATPLIDTPTGKIIGKAKLVDQKGKAVSTPDLLVSAKGGIMNVIITIEGVGGAFRDDPIEIDQKNKAYVPRVSVSMLGNELTFVNNDAILHNVHSYQGVETLYNFAMPKFIKTKSVKLDRPGMIKVRCDVHQEMIAHVMVVDNPFYAISNQAGLFQIDSLPPGTYTVKAWHETLGSVEQQVTITGGEKTAVIFEFPGN